MIATVLEGRVAPERRGDLLREYHARTVELPRGLVQTYLLEDLADPGRWRIVTVWSNREALEAMRSSGATPGGVLTFRAAGAEPELSVWDVAAHARAADD